MSSLSFPGFARVPTVAQLMEMFPRPVPLTMRFGGVFSDNNWNPTGSPQSPVDNAAPVQPAPGPPINHNNNNFNQPPLTDPHEIRVQQLVQRIESRQIERAFAVDRLLERSPLTRNDRVSAWITGGSWTSY